jgi:hypothetical protein
VKPLWLAAAVSCSGAVAFAQGGEPAPWVACAALTGLVEWGLIDGSPEGDLADLTDLVRMGDAAGCLNAVAASGFGTAGLFEPNCVAAITIIMARDWDSQISMRIPHMLSQAIGGAPAACEAIAFSLGATILSSIDI